MKSKEKTKSNHTKQRNALLPIENSIEERTVNVLSEAELTEELRSELLKKLHEFGHAQKFPVVQSLKASDLSHVNIDFGEKVIGKANVKCPYCSKSYLSRYDKIWNTGNLNKHFRAHEDENQIEVVVVQSGVTEQFDANQSHRTEQNGGIDDVELGENENNDLSDETHDNDDENHHDAFDSESPDEASDTSLQRTINLCITALNSPDEIPSPPRRKLRTRNKK